ncbi:hypothetical protein SAMN05444266_101313 [Chitinophaga jiangningensis]|uniref:Uncharacterized protein n=1 Tax=Chitinophaga jiangningensis TaxID=1419482 RepID=A0A1M6VQT0_9BACT|nr:hypothetical protein [Chitinophaga jiangningensis]SHK83691.1 hypothetical protein SAMN05444266_101313 [Chitinophaga jiangningensis]
MNDPQNNADVPKYFIVGNRTVQLLPLANGGIEILKLDWDTGRFVPGEDYLPKVMFGKDEVERVSEDEFIQQTERMRRELFKGDNTVFTLYQLLDTIEATAKQEERLLTAEELGMIALTQRKTYALFDKECRFNENYFKK